MKVTLHPGVVADLQEAATFYEREGSPALAVRFLAEFRRVSRLLIEQPAIGSPRTGGRRGFPLGLFPYTVIYRAEPDEIRILVVKHDRRRPGHGARRG